MKKGPCLFRTFGHGPLCNKSSRGLNGVRELLSSFHLLDSRRALLMQSAALIGLKKKGAREYDVEIES